MEIAYVIFLFVFFGWLIMKVQADLNRVKQKLLERIQSLEEKISEMSHEMALIKLDMKPDYAEKRDMIDDMADWYRDGQPE